MAYVRDRTRIPVPRVLKCHFDTDNNEAWFRMERLRGVQLDQAWPALNDSLRAHTIYQLKSFFEELHTMHPPEPGWIGSCSGGTAYDHRLNSLFAYGPFKTIAEFHDFLVAPIRNCPNPQLADQYRTQFRDDHKIIFAHADLSWEHILIDPSTGEVTGIIDWEMAGFWPEWWEYRKALFGGRTGQHWWVETRSCGNTPGRRRLIWMWRCFEIFYFLATCMAWWMVDFVVATRIYGKDCWGAALESAASFAARSASSLPGTPPVDRKSVV